MAAQGRNGRLMGVAVIAGPLLLTGVVRADPTQADTTSYLNDLHNVGIGDDQGGDAALLQMGQTYASKWDTALLRTAGGLLAATLRHRPGRSWAQPPAGQRPR